MKKNIILSMLWGFLITSCGTGEPESRTDFTIKNNSSYNVKITVFDAVMPNQNSKDTIFLLVSNSELNYYYILDGENKSFDFPFGIADSAYIYFNDSLQIIYRQDDLNPRNILDINSYEGGKVANSYFKYSYIITDEDYENAVNLE